MAGIAVADQSATSVARMTGDEKRVIFASSLGTIFEWYDFYLFGVLTAVIGAQFFAPLDESTRNIFTLRKACAVGSTSWKMRLRPFPALRLCPRQRWPRLPAQSFFRMPFSGADRTDQHG
jgi:hypothetical protein